MTTKTSAMPVVITHISAMTQNARTKRINVIVTVPARTNAWVKIVTMIKANVIRSAMKIPIVPESIVGRQKQHVMPIARHKISARIKIAMAIRVNVTRSALVIISARTKIQIVPVENQCVTQNANLSTSARALIAIATKTRAMLIAMPMINARI